MNKTATRPITIRVGMPTTMSPNSVLVAFTEPELRLLATSFTPLMVLRCAALPAMMQIANQIIVLVFFFMYLLSSASAIALSVNSVSGSRTDSDVRREEVEITYYIFSKIGVT